MPLISVVLGLAFLGFLIYLITTYIPMPAVFKTIIYVLVGLFLIWWLVGITGIGDSIQVPYFGHNSGAHIQIGGR
jgi:hypothetical protein